MTHCALAELNGISSSAKLRAGRSLHRSAASRPATCRGRCRGRPAERRPRRHGTAAAKSRRCPNVYVVRRGDSISRDREEGRAPEGELLRINQLKNPNYIYRGPEAALAAPRPLNGRCRGRSCRGAPSSAPPRVSAAAVCRAAQPPAAAARRCSVTPRAACRLRKRNARARRTPRLSRRAAAGRARRARIGCAGRSAEPGAWARPSKRRRVADPIDYSVGKDDTIVVVAEETLGHYADWLGITAQAAAQDEQHEVRPARC